MTAPSLTFPSSIDPLTSRTAHFDSRATLSLGLILGIAGSIVFMVAIMSVGCTFLHRRRQTAVEQSDCDLSAQQVEFVSNMIFETNTVTTFAESDTAEDRPFRPSLPERLSLSGGSAFMSLI
jgi:hypothetical protein